MLSITHDHARQVALAYHAAWARRDLPTVLDHVADDVVCDTPAGRVEGVLAFADLIGSQLRALERTDLVGAFGDATTAVLIRRDQTLTVPDLRAAVHVTVDNGRITHMSQRPLEHP
jgi:hypothetical protein